MENRIHSSASLREAWQAPSLWDSLRQSHQVLKDPELSTTAFFHRLPFKSFKKKA